MQSHRHIRSIGRRIMGWCLIAAAAGSGWAGAGALAEEVADLTMVGARARGMGGAHTALATGVDAMGWNPAGLAKIDHTVLQADSRLNFGSGTINRGLDFFNAGSAGVAPILRFSDTPGTRFTYYLIGGAAPLPFKGPVAKAGLVGAAAYRRLIDRNFKQEQLIVFDPGGGTSIPLEHLDDSEGGVDAYTLSLAGRPHSRLALGLNVNLLTGFVDELDLQRVSVAEREFFVVETRTRSRVGGHSVELGARLDVLPELTVGAVLRPGYDIELDGGPGRFRQLALEGTGTPLADTTIFFQTPDQTREMPMFYGLGAALTPLPGLVVAADYQYRPWNESVLTVHGPQFGDRTIDERLYPAHSVHVGGEYTFRRESSLNVPLRLGYHSTPTSLANADSLSAAVGAEGYRNYRGDRVEGHTWSGGVGLYFPTVRFDVSVDRTSLTVSEFFFDQVPQPGQPLPIIELEETLTNLYFSSTLRF